MNTFCRPPVSLTSDVCIVCHGSVCKVYQLILYSTPEYGAIRSEFMNS